MVAKFIKMQSGFYRGIMWSVNFKEQIRKKALVTDMISVCNQRLQQTHSFSVVQVYNY